MGKYDRYKKGREVGVGKLGTEVPVRVNRDQSKLLAMQV